MKVKIEIIDNLDDTEIVIRTKEISNEILNLQKIISENSSSKTALIFYKGEKEYFINYKKILFFQTNNRNVEAHTRDNMYTVKRKLYELEDLLPNSFMRISKSCILNVDLIYSIKKNITSVSEIEFRNTNKKVLISRHYFKALQDKIESRRQIYD